MYSCDELESLSEISRLKDSISSLIGCLTARPTRAGWALREGGAMEKAFIIFPVVWGGLLTLLEGSTRHSRHYENVITILFIILWDVHTLVGRHIGGSTVADSQNRQFHLGTRQFFWQKTDFRFGLSGSKNLRIRWEQIFPMPFWFGQILGRFCNTLHPF